MQHKDAYFWGLISKFGPITIQMLSNFILARILTPADFGTIGVLAIIFTVAGVLIDSGLGGSLVKEESITSKDCSTIASFNATVSLLIYALLFASADYIESFFEIERLSLITRILSLTFLIGAWGVVPHALLMRDLKFKTITIISITSILIASLIAILFALMNYGVWSLVLFQLTNSLTSVILSSLACKYIPRIGFNLKSFKKLFSFGFFTTVTIIIDTIYENLLTTLAGKFLNVNHAGYMNQAKKIEEGLSTSVIKAINNVTFPILTKLKKDEDSFLKESQSIYKVITMLSIPVLLTIALFPELAIKFFLGNQWLSASFYLKMLLFAGIIMVFESLIRSFIKSYCAVSLLMNATIVKRIIGVIVIVASMLINPTYIVYGYVLSSIIGYLINSYVFCKILNYSFCNFQWGTIKILFPAFMYYLLIDIGLMCWGQYQILCFSVSIILLILYYLLILPIYGFNINSIAAKFLNKRIHNN